MNPASPSPAAAGWYPAPDGTQRYWDGAQWLDIPPPPTGNSQSPDTPPSKPRRTGVLIAVSLALVLALGAGGFAYKSHQDKLAAEEAAAIAQAEADALLAAELELQEIALAEEEAAKQEEERVAAAEERERQARKRDVAAIERSIEKMAKDHIKEGLINGEVLEVSCAPVAGGSIEILLESTTTFECFVATEDNKDGTFSGYHYHATMNWDSGAYNYGFGRP